jgi:molybdopterin-binding protein
MEISARNKIKGTIDVLIVCLKQKTPEFHD